MDRKYDSIAQNGAIRSTMNMDFTVDRSKAFKQEKFTANFFTETKIDLKQSFDVPINVVCFSPFDESYDILACCCKERIYVYRIIINEKTSIDKNVVNYEFISDYICGSPCVSLCFGPKTSFQNPTEQCLNLSAATEDFSILVLTQKLFKFRSADDSEQQFFVGHINHINDMAFEPINGDYLASTGDDCMCIIRSLKENNCNKSDTRIMLSSPGMTLKWHKNEPNKLFVAEKKGLIRFYDTITRVAVMSFDCNCYPLISSDWCFENNLFIGCAANKDLYFWDTSLTSLPIKVIRTNFERLLEFQFFDSKLIAYRGRPNNFLCVKNFITNQTFIEKEFVAGRGISWNRKIPLLAVGGPKCIHLFRFNVF
ncbi:BUD31 protein [Sarcoptes scabiei]|nr:BUD31 protein [Sarcoptes scabiei]